MNISAFYLNRYYYIVIIIIIIIVIIIWIYNAIVCCESMADQTIPKLSHLSVH